MIVVESVAEHVRGELYRLRVGTRRLQLLLTFHSLKRLEKWRVAKNDLFETLLFPEEVVIGHHDRYIAHRRYGEHIIRAVYEYEDGIPSVITVYFPRAERYFEGGKKHEDKILK